MRPHVRCQYRSANQGDTAIHSTRSNRRALGISLTRARCVQVKIIFDVPVKARYVRILPQTYYNWMSMRAAVLLCERPCLKDTLVYNFHDASLLSTTKGPR